MATTSRPWLRSAFSKGFTSPLEHRHVSRHSSILIVADKGCPRVESHAGVDCRAHLLQLQVVASDSDLVDRSALLAFVTHDLCDFARVELAGLQRNLSRSGTGM